MTSQGSSSILPQTGSLKTFGKPPRASPAPSRCRTGDSHFFARFSAANFIVGQQSDVVFESSSRRIVLPFRKAIAALIFLRLAQAGRLRRFDCCRSLVI